MRPEVPSTHESVAWHQIPALHKGLWRAPDRPPGIAPGRRAEPTSGGWYLLTLTFRLLRTVCPRFRKRVNTRSGRVPSRKIFRGTPPTPTMPTVDGAHRDRAPTNGAVGTALNVAAASHLVRLAWPIRSVETVAFARADHCGLSKPHIGAATGRHRRGGGSPRTARRA